MAERDEEERAEEKEVFQEERPKRKLPLKMLIIIAGGFLVIAALGGVAYFKVIAPRMSGQAPADDQAALAAQQGSQQPTPAGEEKATLGPMFQLDPFIANLADEGANRYLKARMELEVSDEAVAAELDNRLPQIRDMVLVLLSSKTFADIRTPRGKAQIRDEIIMRANSALTAGEVRQVYFTEFVVQ